ncbi:MAG: hypothetical protein QMD14_01685 [Candidatus Aenigmarchaeota archaeon]|nr:hypothetical protein [Candidatus Aenigmarchaeota archaeon]
MVKRKISLEIYIIAGIITISVLIAGVYFGLFLSGEKVKFLESELARVRISGDDATLQFVLLNFFPNESCSILEERFYEIQMKTAKLGSKVEEYERTEKIKAPEFYELKKAYTIILLNYWYYAKKLKEECNQTFLTILYFYSNVYCPDCPKQGAALGYIKEKYREKAMIFSLDFDLGKELGSVKLLRLGYNVTIVPTLVVDDERYEGLVTADELEKIFYSKLAIG